MFGCSVTERIKKIKQPRGGYIKTKMLREIELGAGIEELNPEENISANLVGLAVDYLTRFMLGASPEEAFSISLLGANIINKEKKAKRLLKSIRGLDNISIINSVKLSGYDVCYRAGIARYKPVEKIKPDSATIKNIRIMVKRSLKFFELYGPMVLNGFSFDGGYTRIISSGDGDFITEDTLWDFKVSKTKPKHQHLLQIFIYWRMGLHSIYYPEFHSVEHLGIYNPRLNKVYLLDVKDIPDEVTSLVEKEVIGYQNE